MKPIIATLMEKVSSAAGPEETPADKFEAQERANRGMKKGGMVSSASKRADGCAIRGKTKGKIV